MPPLSDAELYARGSRTLLASWEAYARGSHGAAVVRSCGVASAVFPTEPERSVYNNALLERDLEATERATAVDAMEGAFASAGVTRYAAWVHESDAPLRADLEARGYRVEETTRAMGMALSDLRMPRPEVDLASPSWPAYVEHLHLTGAPRGILKCAEPAAFHVLLARWEGETVTTGLAFDLAGDCGIYNIGTFERARRRGLGTAVTALLAHDATGRGCRTASLQSTPMAEGVYTAVGFRDLGRILEYGPPRE